MDTGLGECAKVNIYVINLKRRHVRRAEMERQAEALQIPIKIVEAIDGKSLTDEYKKQVVNRFRWWCVTGLKPRDGEIGSCLSHQAVYKMILASGCVCACILEDDIRFERRFMSVLTAVEKFVEGRCKPIVVLMTPHPNRGPEKVCDGDVKFEKISWAFSAGGYVVNKQAAMRLLAANIPINATVDNWGRWVSRAGIYLYNVWPIVCMQDAYGKSPISPDFVSDTIDPDTVFVSEYPFCKLIVHKFLRIVGVLIDRLIPMKSQPKGALGIG